MRNSDRRPWLKLATLLMIVGLLVAACGDDGGEDENGGSGNQAADFDLVTDGTLTVGSDIPYKPFEFEEGGKLTGFDVEIVRGIAEKIGLSNTDADWLSVDFGTIFQQLQSGTSFDVVAAAVTGYALEGSPASKLVAERTSLIDFTIPYYPSLQSVAINTAEGTEIKGVDSLPDGARVGVQAATTGAFYAQENLTGAEIVEFEKAPEMYQQLEAGQLDAVFNDLPVSLQFFADNPETTIKVVEQVETGEEYAIAVSKENTELKEAMNAALEEMFEDGSYAEIFKKYFPEQTLPDYASE